MNTKQLVFSIMAYILASCAMTPTQQAEMDSLATTVAPLVQAYAQTGHISYAQAIPVALNSLAVFAPASSVNTAQLASNIDTAVSAFTDGTSGSTGQRIASAVLDALPANPNGAQVNAALAQAGIGASNGSN
jgi:hypothetical protein